MQEDRIHKKVFIFALNCPRRNVDVNLLAEYFKLNGWGISDSIDGADLAVIHTCAFDQASEDASIFSISKANRLKRENTKLIVGGCLPKINKSRLNSVFKGDVLSPGELDKMDEIIHARVKLSQVKEPNVLESFGRFGDTKGIASALYFDTALMRPHNGAAPDRYVSAYPDSAYPADEVYNIRVARGCRGKCTYCAIRFATGKLESKPLNEVLSEFNRGLQKNFKIFTLIGEDIGAYGADIGTNVAALMEGILNIEGPYKLIIKDINMNWFIKYFAKLKQIFKARQGKLDYIIIPLQSGSTGILRSMGRGYTQAETLKSLYEIKKEIPGLKLWTHMIVGFPGETDKDFEDTLELMKAYPFSLIEIHKYSDRPKTIASRMKNKISEKVKEMRLKQALELRHRLQRG